MAQRSPATSGIVRPQPLRGDQFDTVDTGASAATSRLEASDRPTTPRPRSLTTDDISRVSATRVVQYRPRRSSEQGTMAQPASLPTLPHDKVELYRIYMKMMGTTSRPVPECDELRRSVLVRSAFRTAFPQGFQRAYDAAPAGPLLASPTPPPTPAADPVSRQGTPVPPMPAAAAAALPAQPQPESPAVAMVKALANALQAMKGFLDPRAAQPDCVVLTHHEAAAPVDAFTLGLREMNFVCADIIESLCALRTMSPDERAMMLARVHDRIVDTHKRFQTRVIGATRAPASNPDVSQGTTESFTFLLARSAEIACQCDNIVRSADEILSALCAEMGITASEAPATPGHAAIASSMAEVQTAMTMHRQLIGRFSEDATAVVTALRDRPELAGSPVHTASGLQPLSLSMLDHLATICQIQLQIFSAISLQVYHSSRLTVNLSTANTIASVQRDTAQRIRAIATESLASTLGEVCGKLNTSNQSLQRNQQNIALVRQALTAPATTALSS